jgi:transcriptional regulator with XRE-family HTH domain
VIDPGPRLRQLRRSRGWTLEELEARSGIPARTLQRWELRECLPRLDLLDYAARALGVTLIELLEDGNETRP